MNQKRKVYAVQVPYDNQESPWQWWTSDQVTVDKAAVYGNHRDYIGQTFEEFDAVIKALEEIDWEGVGNWYATEQELLLDYVPPVGRDIYTDEEIAQWKTAYDLYNAGYGRNERQAICMGLTLMMDKE